MKAINFNTGWSYRHLDVKDENFQPVQIPHDAMLYEPRTELAASGMNGGWFEGRDYEYVKHFRPGKEFAGKELVLEFEGVYHDAEVWVNGKKTAFRPFGYTNFYVNVTDLVAIDQNNEIRVVARNSDQPNSRWYSGAGIYRPVTLWTGAKQHIKINGIAVTTLSIDPPRIEVAIAATAPGTVNVEVTAAGPAVSDVWTAEATLASDNTTVVQIDMPAAQLWGPKNPNLYTCTVKFESESGAHDTGNTRFGIRTLEWGENGFLINGERVILQGACIHHDNGVLGARAFDQAEERKIRLMQQQGYNAIRSAHNPCSKALLDACDRLGMLVMDEYLDHWYIHKTRHDYVKHFDRWWRTDLEDMALKDRNHPSVIMYSIGNEVSETAQKRGIELTEKMVEHLHRLDPTRPVTCGVNIFFNLLSSLGLGVYSDKKSEKEAADADKRRLEGKGTGKKKPVGSEFFNTLAGIVGAGFMKIGATMPGCDAKTRGAFAKMDIAGYNYGIKRYKTDLRRYPERLILGTETFCSDAFTFREFAKNNPRLIGDFVWAGMDYLGEAGVGAWEYGDYYEPSESGFGWLTAGSGRVDLTGKPLGEALYTRVALEMHQGPFMAVKPVNHTGEKHSPSAWKMSNATDSWSWNGYEGKPADIEIYARAAEVALLINGHEIGRKKMRDNCIATFRCNYEAGVVEAVSYDQSGHEMGRCELKSASNHTELRIEPESSVAARGELVFVRVRYADENGIGKPLERGTLRASVDGGTLLGFGSAAPFNTGSFVNGETGTYFGEALAVIQVGSDAEDTVSITVTDGSFTASKTIPVKVRENE